MTSSELLMEINNVSAFAAVLATTLLVWGFVRLSVKSTGIVRHLALGLMLMHLVVFLRTGYWHIVSILVPLWKVGSVIESDFGTVLLVVFNLIVVVSGYFSLKALWLAIPATRRSDYSLIGAAFYPKGRSLVARGRSVAHRVRAHSRRGDDQDRR